MFSCPEEGCTSYQSLNEAMIACNSQKSCGGIVKQPETVGTKFKYSTRGDFSWKASTFNETAWTCHDDTLECTKFPLQRGSERERCEGGNELRRDEEYVYKSKDCSCTCCKRPREILPDSNLPKIMTVLIVNVNMSDYQPQYGSLKDIENKV